MCWRPDRPVLYMGGFNGSDPVVSADDLQYLVESGRLRFIYYGSGGGNRAQMMQLIGWPIIAGGENRF